MFTSWISLSELAGDGRIVNTSAIVVHETSCVRTDLVSADARWPASCAPPEQFATASEADPPVKLPVIAMNHPEAVLARLIDRGMRASQISVYIASQGSFTSASAAISRPSTFVLGQRLDRENA